jgi:subtilisin family serine protease
MASPAAAGVAAIIRGYFPELSAEEVRDVLMKTVTKTNKKIKIPGLSGSKSKGQMNDVCISSGFINAESAVRLLLDIEAKKP